MVTNMPQQPDYKTYKLLSLPTTPIPNAVLYILDQTTNPNTAKVYITDSQGTPVPIAVVSLPPSGYITSPDGSIEITSVPGGIEAQVSTSLQNLINNAVQPGDNTSSLTNDGEDGVNPFITSADIPAETDPIFTSSPAGGITVTDINNWNSALDDLIVSANFNTSNGDLTLVQDGGGTITVNLDGRYLTSATDSQTLSWNFNTGVLSISNGNSVILDGRYALINHAHSNLSHDESLTGGVYNGTDAQVWGINPNYTGFNNYYTTTEVNGLLGSYVQSVTGDGVDNTDPQNPVLSYPTATEVDYNNATSGLTATEVQSAIDEINGNLSTHEADQTNPHNVTAAQTGAEPAFTKGSLIQGTGSTLTGTLTNRLVGTGDVTIAHSDTSTQGSVDNTDGNVIQDVTLDGFGHITALGSTDLDTRYDAIGSAATAETNANSYTDGQLTNYYTQTQIDGFNFARMDFSNIGNFDISGNLTIDSEIFSTTQGDVLLRGASGATILSSNNNSTVIRPLGDSNSTNQSLFNINGQLILGGQATVFYHAVRADRTINGSNGIDPLGDLTADRTLSLDFNYLDTRYASGFKQHDAVRVLSDTNIDLTGAETIDGVSLADNDRVLAIGQTDPADNGSYSANTGGVWTRTTDFDAISSDEITQGASFFVEEGTNYGGTGWTLQSDPTTLGTDPLNFIQYAGTANYVGGDLITITGNTINHDAGSWVAKTDLSGANVISNLSVDGFGHLTDWTTRVLTAGDIGAQTPQTTLAGYGITDGWSTSDFTQTDINNWNAAWDRMVTGFSLAHSTGMLTIDRLNLSDLTVDLGYTNTDMSNWNTAYTHSQITSGNPHGVSYSNILGTAPSINWGDIGGTLSNQVDLQSALDGKENATKQTATFIGSTDDLNSLTDGWYKWEGVSIPTNIPITGADYGILLQVTEAQEQQFAFIRLDDGTTTVATRRFDGGTPDNDPWDISATRAWVTGQGYLTSVDLGTVGSTGLRTITNTAGANVNIPVVNGTEAGVMSSGQFNTLNSALQSGDNISELTNDAGYTTNDGTVTSVSGGNGLTGSVTTSGNISMGTPDTLTSSTTNSTTSTSHTHNINVSTISEDFANYGQYRSIVINTTTSHTVSGGDYRILFEGLNISAAITIILPSATEHSNRELVFSWAGTQHDVEYSRDVIIDGTTISALTTLNNVPSHTLVSDGTNWHFSNE